MTGNELGKMLGDMGHSVLSFLPAALAFIAILAIGYLAARLLRAATAKGLRRAGFDRAVERGVVGRALRSGQISATDLCAKVAFYAVLLLALQLAFGVWGPNPVSAVLTALLAWLPRAFVAIVIVLVTAVIASATHDLVAGALAALHYGRFLARAISITIVTLGVLAALDQIQIATAVTQPLLIAVLATAAGVVIVGVGGGLIRPMQQRWEIWLSRAGAESAAIREHALAYVGERRQSQTHHEPPHQTEPSAEGTHEATAEPPTAIVHTETVPKALSAQAVVDAAGTADVPEDGTARETPTALQPAPAEAARDAAIAPKAVNANGTVNARRPTTTHQPAPVLPDEPGVSGESRVSSDTGRVSTGRVGVGGAGALHFHRFSDTPDEPADKAVDAQEAVDAASNVDAREDMRTRGTVDAHADVDDEEGVSVREVVDAAGVAGRLGEGSRAAAKAHESSWRTWRTRRAEMRRPADTTDARHVGGEGAGHAAEPPHLERRVPAEQTQHVRPKEAQADNHRTTDAVPPRTADAAVDLDPAGEPMDFGDRRGADAAVVVIGGAEETQVIPPTEAVGTRANADTEERVETSAKRQS